MNRLFDALTFGPTRRRRSFDKQFQQLSEAYRSGAPLGGPEPPRGGPSRRPAPPGGFGSPATPTGPGTGRLLLVLAVIVVLVGGVLVAARSVGGSSRPGSLESFSPVPDEPSSSRPGTPPAGVGSRPERLLPAVAFPPGTGGYRFFEPTASGGSVTWDPCRPITVVTRSAPGKPSSGDRLVQEALAAIQQASGLMLVQEGASDEAPTADRQPYQPQRYGRRWAPVLLAWSDPQETPLLAGRVLGVGGPRPATAPDDPAIKGYVTGSVTLDGPELAQLARSRDTAAARAVVEHELGHLLGLDHVPDRTQLMYSETEVGVTSYQSGDRRGLAQLGAGQCMPEL